MATRKPNATKQHFDRSTKAPLAGGQMFFYEPGTTTFKDTFSDQAATIPNENPVILDGSGFEPNIFGNGSYRIVLQNSSGIQQFDRDPVVFESETGAFANWNSTTTYEVNDIVEGSDGAFYIAIVTNSNMTPQNGANPEVWTRFDLIKRWNPNETYLTNDPVRGSDGILYTAIQESTNVDPTLDTDGSHWKMFDNIRIDGNLISAITGQVDIQAGPGGAVSIITSGGAGDINLDTVTAGDINLTSASGDINLDAPSGELLSNTIPVSLAPVTQQVFDDPLSNPHTWTKPANVKYIMIEGCGGGGGGGASNSAVTEGAAQGGGAGGSFRDVIDVTSISTLTIDIGSGGAGGINSNGSAGGATTVVGTGVNISGNGGQGGLFGAQGTNFNTNNGGTSTGAAVNITGGDGGFGIIITPTVSLAGNGGGSSLSGGPAGPQTFQAATIQNGNNANERIGCGGSGGSSIGGPLGSNALGGDGGDGIVIITEYR